MDHVTFELRDHLHDETHGHFGSRNEAIAEAARLAALPWNQTPNLAPCARWDSCGRKLLEVGMVSVNAPSQTQPELPFGGVKASGVGRELGEYGMGEFVNRKLIRAAAAYAVASSPDGSGVNGSGSVEEGDDGEHYSDQLDRCADGDDGSHLALVGEEVRNDLRDLVSGVEPSVVAVARVRRAKSEEEPDRSDDGDRGADEGNDACREGHVAEPIVRLAEGGDQRSSGCDGKAGGLQAQTIARVLPKSGLRLRAYLFGGGVDR